MSYYEYVDPTNFLANVFIEEEERQPSPTGLLDSNGSMIFKCPVSKPKFGFPIRPEDNKGYECDTDSDYFYVVSDG